MVRGKPSLWTKDQKLPSESCLSASEERSVVRKPLTEERAHFVGGAVLTILLLFVDLMRREIVQVLNPKGKAESVIIKIVIPRPWSGLNAASNQLTRSFIWVLARGKCKPSHSRCLRDLRKIVHSMQIYFLFLAFFQKKWILRALMEMREWGQETGTKPFVGRGIWEECPWPSWAPPPDPRSGWGRIDFAFQASLNPPGHGRWIKARGWGRRKEGETDDSELDQRAPDQGAQRKPHVHQPHIIAHQQWPAPPGKSSARPVWVFPRRCEREELQKRAQFERLNNFTQREN